LIPDGVTGIFHGHNPSGRTMALESTQPSSDMSTRNISCAGGGNGGGKDGRCIRLTTLPPSCANCHEIRAPQPYGTLRDCFVLKVANQKHYVSETQLVFFLRLRSNTVGPHRQSDSQTLKRSCLRNVVFYPFLLFLNTRRLTGP